MGAVGRPTTPRGTVARGVGCGCRWIGDRWADLLGGRVIDFTEGDFFGDISFVGTRFAAQEIHFDRPKAWVGTHFDWDDVPTRKPASVKPNPWPPAAAV